MKTNTLANKIKCLALALLMTLSVLLLCACDEKDSYSISLYYVSGTKAIPTLSGQGTYLDGDTVTLKARSSGSSHFIGWLYQNKTLLSNNPTYTITTAQDNMSSTLTFIANKNTADNYTAVFEDDGQPYYIVSSYRLSKSDTDDGEDKTIEYSSELFSGTIKVDFINQTNMTSRNAITIEQTFYNQVPIEVEETNQVVNIMGTTPLIGITFSNDTQQEYKRIELNENKENLEEGIIITKNSDKSYTLGFSFQTQVVLGTETTNENCTIKITISPLKYKQEADESNSEEQNTENGTSENQI